MRFGTVVTGVAVCALALPAFAHAEVTRTFVITASPAKSSTKTKKNPVTLKASITQSDSTGAIPPTLTKATLLLPPGSTWNGNLFPRCTAAMISAEKSVDPCPPGSLVGKGRITGAASGGIVQNDVTINVANGGADRVNLFVEGSSPLRLQSNVEVRLTKLTGKYGLKADIPVPASLQEPVAGVFVGITKLDLSLGATRKVKGVKRGLIEVTQCKGTWSGEGTMEFRNAEPFTQSQSIPCKKG